MKTLLTLLRCHYLPKATLWGGSITHWAILNGMKQILFQAYSSNKQFDERIRSVGHVKGQENLMRMQGFHIVFIFMWSLYTEYHYDVASYV